MSVRALDSERELERALELTARAWREAFDGLLSDAELDHTAEAFLTDVAGQYERLRDSDARTTLVATAEGAVVGWTSTVRGVERTREYVGAEEAEIRMLYVDPERWGEGIGTALLTESRDRLPDATRRVVLETFRDNELGRSFYESRGFSRRGTTEFEVAGNAYPSVVLARPV